MNAIASASQASACAVSHARGAWQQGEEEQWRLVDASHELRTPLTALRTEVELALLGNRDASELRAALTSAAEEIRRVCRLADDILTLARADHGRLPLQPRPLEPRFLLEAAAARACGEARTQGRQIVVRDTPPGTRLLADPDRAAQALDNLVSNALQYGSGTISLTARAEGTLIGLHVTDEGAGFARDIAARAFQRFTRGKHARSPGTGIGLSLVAAIASAHHGKAALSNLPEGGADVCIALPPYVPVTLSAVTSPPGAAALTGDPEDARAATARLASQAAVRQRPATGQLVPCRRSGASRARPPRKRQTARSTGLSRVSRWSGKTHCMTSKK